jgi:DNA-directed RNA polymerase specialized sigma24 family protein
VGRTGTGDNGVLEEVELAQLVASARAGDPVSLEHLLAKLRPLVMRRCSRFLPYHADAEEAAQDALLSISTHLHEYSGRGSFLGWVTVIASNSARSTYRSMCRRDPRAGRRPVTAPLGPEGSPNRLPTSPMRVGP